MSDGMFELATRWRELCRIVLAIIILSSADVGVQGQGCQTYVSRPDGSQVCYNFVGTMATWDSARRQCASYGPSWHLPTVASSAENTKLLSVLDNNGIPATWLGASEEASTWKWMDGTEVSYQGCYGDSGTSRDMETVTSLGNQNSPSVCIEHCRTLSYKYAGLEASTDCWCSNSFGRYGQAVGAMCTSPCPGSQSGQTCGGNSDLDVYTVSGSYSNWLSGRPLNAAGNINCAIFTSNDYQWESLACSDTGFGAFCDIGAPASEQDCLGRPNSFLTADGRCVDVVVGSLSFFTARVECRQRGGDLAQLRTADDTSRAQQHIDSLKQAGTASISSGFWIGLIRTRWSWESGDDFLYTNWLSGSPTPPAAAGVQQCGVMTRTQTVSTNGFWNNVACNTTRYFVCQSVTASSRTTTLRTTVAAAAAAAATTTTPRSTRQSTGSEGGETVVSVRTTASSNAIGPDGNSSDSSSDNVASVTTAAANAAQNVDRKERSLSTGALIGIICGAVGAVLFLILIVLVVVCCRRHKRMTGGGQTTSEKIFQFETSSAVGSSIVGSKNPHPAPQTVAGGKRASKTTKNSIANLHDSRSAEPKPAGNYYFGVTINDLKEPVTPDPTYEWIDVRTENPEDVPRDVTTASLSSVVTAASSSDDVYTNSREMLVPSTDARQLQTPNADDYADIVIDATTASNSHTSF